MDGPYLFEATHDGQSYLAIKVSDDLHWQYMAVDISAENLAGIKANQLPILDPFVLLGATVFRANLLHADKSEGERQVELAVIDKTKIAELLPQPGIRLYGHGNAPVGPQALMAGSSG